MAKKTRLPRAWMLPSTQRLPVAPLPEKIKADLDAKATKLVEKLKPKYVKPPPKKPQFNYIIDVWTSGRGIAPTRDGSKASKSCSRNALQSNRSACKMLDFPDALGPTNTVNRSRST